LDTPPASYRVQTNNNKMMLTIEEKPKMSGTARKGFVKINASGFQTISRQSPVPESMRCSRRNSVNPRVKYSGKKHTTRQTSPTDSDGCNANQSVEEERGSSNNYDLRSMTPQLIFRPNTPSVNKLRVLHEKLRLTTEDITLEQKIQDTEQENLILRLQLKSLEQQVARIEITLKDEKKKTVSLT
jgi:hypothetical protein